MAGFADDMSAWWKSPGARTLKRSLLGILTMGTSEIKTGGGAYGDEVLADSLFPKTINDFLLDDRADARKATDAKKAAELAKYQPGPAPDLATKLVQEAGGNAKLRQATKSGRRSTFLSGGGY